MSFHNGLPGYLKMKQLATIFIFKTLEINYLVKETDLYNIQIFQISIIEEMNINSFFISFSSRRKICNATNDYPILRD